MPAARRCCSPGITRQLSTHIQKYGDVLWRAHSCVPRRDSSRRLFVYDDNSKASVELRLDAARTSARATLETDTLSYFRRHFLNPEIPALAGHTGTKESADWIALPRLCRRLAAVMLGIFALGAWSDSCGEPAPAPQEPKSAERQASSDRQP
jgi:hypothetical protein